MTLDMLLVLELLIRRALDRVQAALAEAREAQKTTERGLDEGHQIHPTRAAVND